MLLEYWKVDDDGVRLNNVILDSDSDIPDNHFPSWGNRVFNNPSWDFELEDWVETTPVEDYLESLKESHIVRLKIACNRDILSGFQATNGHIYEFDTHDQTNFTQRFLLMLNDSEMDDIVWKTVDAGVVLHSREEFMQVCKDAEDHKEGKIFKYWQLKGLVEQCETYEDIMNIEW